MNNNPNPFVVVLMLNYNGQYLLEEGLSSYLANTYLNYKIVLIDNGSTDNSVAFVKEHFPKVDILELKTNRAYSGGFNAGLKYAFNQLNAEHVIVTNNDVKADKELVSSLVETLSRWDNVGFITGKVYYYDNQNTFQTIGKKEDAVWWNGGHIGNKVVDNGQYDDECERFFADDVFTLVTGQLYGSVGGYDETFKFQAEEFDWQARGKAKGFKIIYCPKAKLWHKESMTIGKTSAFKAYYNAKNPLIVIFKHKKGKFARRYLWMHFKNRVVKSSIRSIIKEKDIKKSLVVWKGFISALLWRLRTHL